MNLVKTIQIELLTYRFRKVLMFSKKLHVFSGNHNKSFICRRCVSSYANAATLTKHKQGCEQQEVTSIKTSKESLLFRKTYFHKMNYTLEIMQIVKLLLKSKVLLQEIKQLTLVKNKILLVLVNMKSLN